jgi:alkylation response protein AidB-like acyl-CoA dehydrogenase
MTEDRDVLLQAVATLAPELDRRAGEGETATTMPADLIAKAKAAGLCRLGLPRTLGGWECDPLTMLEVIARLAEADGSAAWSVMIGNSTAFLAWLEPDAAKEIVAGDPNISSTGMFAPMGKAVAHGNGTLSVTGRWPFNSGCPHSEWLMAGVIVHDGDAPRMVAPGRPDWRFAWFPHGDAEIFDNWHVAGLRGTGSNDLAVHGITVSESRTCMPFFEPARHDGPLYRLSFFTLVAALLSGFPLGLARRALDEFTAVAAAKARGGGERTMAHDEAIQVQYALAEGGVQAANAMVVDALGDAWNTVVRGDECTLDQRARVILASQMALRSSTAAVDAVFTLTGASALYDDSPLQRCFRDVHAAAQHIFFSQDALKRYSKARFGLEDPTRFML